MAADVTAHQPRTVLECPRCDGDHLALEYCGCASGQGDVYACQNYDCDYEVTRGGEEDLVRELRHLLRTWGSGLPEGPALWAVDSARRQVLEVLDRYSEAGK